MKTYEGFKVNDKIRALDHNDIADAYIEGTIIAVIETEEEAAKEGLPYFYKAYKITVEASKELTGENKRVGRKMYVPMMATFDFDNTMPRVRKV